MKSVIILLISITFSSCNLIRLLQVDEVNNESTEEIADFLSKKRIKYDYSILLIDSINSPLGDSLHKLEVYSEPSAIQVRIYNSDGSLYSGFTQCSGGFNDKKFLGHIYPPKRKMYENTNKNLMFNSEFELWNISKSEKNEILKNAVTKEYIFVVYWNIWTNYFSKVVLKEVTRYKKEFQDEEFLIILVNNAREKN